MPVHTPVPRSAHTDAYTRLTEAFPGLEITELGAREPAPRTGGWIPAASLAEGGTGLDTFLEWDDAQILRDYGTRARPDVVASFGLHRYAWPACLLITMPWFLQRRVPRLPVARVSYDRTAPGLSIGRMAVRPAGFSCLPGDPAAALPGAHVVADEEALRAQVRTAVAEHLEPVLAAFGPRMRRRGRALWGMATDEIVEGLWYVAHLLGEERRAMRELEALLPGATKPYAGSAAFRVLTGPNGETPPAPEKAWGDPQITRDRTSCCMFYTVRPEDICATCPRTCGTNRSTKPLAAAAS
ncbi:(2Fe-2S)-binding protein [Streptomyces spinosisporus]|uniref:(2Fe-2S)-binding protein n=1 Tax=Streptomyces spinosisporus TaxID=2927582 RepID=A0ABS9X8S9_9ACTN|nr:(2Fe-2S)-binding protein [Streptomyces spinosisporus]MCI3238471.1 (2Fe-2S)-binding protein [Streptomyces spinosisporus]